MRCKEITITRAADKMVAETGAEGATVWVCDRFGVLTAAAARGPARWSLEGETLPRGSGIAGSAAKLRHPIVVSDAYRDSNFNPHFDRRSQFLTTAVLAVPVVGKDEQTLGVLQVVNAPHPGGFPLSAVETLRHLAQRVNGDVERASLRISLETLWPFVSSLTDRWCAMRAELPHGTNKVMQSGSILFADLSDYTSLARTRSPGESSAVLSDLFSLIIPQVTVHGGLLDKIIGDAALFVFLREDGEDCAARALAAADALEQVAEPYLQKLRAGCSLPLSFRVGIASGEFVLGPVGGDEFKNATVIGATVNRAKRLQEQAVRGGVAVDSLTHRWIAPSEWTKFTSRVQILPSQE